MERHPSSCGERREWVGGWVDCIYTKSVAFIQFQTGIYTIPNWHLYNSTLAFIQVMSLLRFLPKLFMALCHERHVDKLNACHPWQSAAQFFFFLPKLLMALCHERHADKLNACHPWQSAAQFFFFLPKTPHGTLP